MLKLSVFIVFCGLMLGFNPQPASAEPGDPVKGKIIYERHCVTCHGTQGKGEGPAGSLMTPHPADLTSPKSRSKPHSELLQTIKDGRSGTSMAGFKGTLSEQQIHEVLAYVRSFGK